MRHKGFFYSAAGLTRLKARCTELKAAGWTYEEIAAELTSANIPRRDGGTVWTAQTVWSLVRYEKPVRKHWRCVHCQQRPTSSASSKYCATCKDEVMAEQRRAAQRAKYLREHPDARR